MPAYVPQKNILAAVQPNPFNKISVLRYSLSAQSVIRLRVYDIAGRAVRTLVHDRLEPGYYVATWDACDDSGIRLPAGVYFISYSVQPVDGANGYHQVEKNILLKQ
jgi:flagellar hook assembly protein FlgD